MAESQSKTEKSFIQADISIGDIDSIFSSLLWASFTTMPLIISLLSEILIYLSLQTYLLGVFKVHHILCQLIISPSSPQVFLHVLLTPFKTDYLLFLNIPANFTPKCLCYFRLPDISGLFFKAEISSVKSSSYSGERFILSV